MKNILLLSLFVLFSNCSFGQMPVPFTDGEKWGYATSPDKKVVIPLKYSESGPFNKNGFALVTESGQNVVIDASGKEIIRVPSGYMIQQLSGHNLMVSQDSKYGVYDLNTGKFTGLVYTSMDGFSNGYAPYDMGTVSGLLSEDLSQTFHGKFEKVYSPSEGLCAAKINGLWGYVDMKGKVVIKPQFGIAESFSEGLACAGNSIQSVGFIDKTGKQVIPFEYNMLMGAKFRDGIVNVMKNGAFGCMDSKGNFVVPLENNVVRYDGDGVFVRIQNNKRIFFDRTGKKIFDREFPSTSFYSNGLFRVGLRNVSSFMDINGKYLFPFWAEFQSLFNDGLAIARYNDKKVYVDTAGIMYCTFPWPVEHLLPANRNLLAQADTLTRFNSHWIAAMKNEVQIFDSTGQRIPTRNLVTFDTRDKYAIFRDISGNYFFYDEKMKPVAGNELKMLEAFFLKIEQIKWYESWRDSSHTARRSEFIELGDHKWMLKDLNVTTFRNGDTIYQAPDFWDFIIYTSGSEKKPAMFTWIPKEPGAGQITIYNRLAFEDKRGLIPAGYKIPGRAEWQSLLNYAAGDSKPGEFLTLMGFKNKGSLPASGVLHELVNNLWLVNEKADPGRSNVLYLNLEGEGTMSIEPNLEIYGIAIRCVKE